MNKNNFFVGDGLEGAEKCRKKFSNLQTSYIKYKDKRHQTGQGKIIKPPFIEEMEEILGKKDKITPQLVIDSASCSNISAQTEVSDETVSDNEPKNQEDSKSSTSTQGSVKRKNKFINIKSSVKPDKNTLLTKMIDLQKEEMVERRSEFDRMMTFLETTSLQRHEQVMALVRNKSKSQKRKHYSDDSDD